MRNIRPVSIITSDGSHSLYMPELNEHYHSVNGAITESQHVYITAGLKACFKKQISILEVGLGTGLNAFLTFLEAKKRELTIEYDCLEKYPLDDQIISQLNYASILSPENQGIFSKIHEVPWEVSVSLSSFFSIKKIRTDVNDYAFNEKSYDVVYYDAFAPDKQPEVWNSDIFEKIYAAANSQGILTTYCAKGEIRRIMQKVGFKVERIPGPPGKREMLRACKV